MEFLQKFNEIVKCYAEGSRLTDKQQNAELRELYYALSYEEQYIKLTDIMNCIKINTDAALYLLTYLLHVLNDGRIIDFILSLMESGAVDALTVLNVIYQTGVFAFSSTDGIQGKEQFRHINGLYINQIKRLTDSIEPSKLEYIPVNRRNKGNIIIVTRSLLGEKHAPTMMLCNLYNYLEKAGYNVIVLVNYMGRIQQDKYFWIYDAAIDNNLVEDTQKLQADHFGLCLNICNIAFTSQLFYQELNMAVDYVRAINPEFIIDVGGQNIIADVCSRFTTVCSFPCVGTPVHSAAQVVVRRFHCEGEAEIIYNSYLTQNQKVYELMIANELTSVSNMAGTNAVTSGKSNRFILLIVGNRLDREITDEFLDMLNGILEGEPEVYVKVIGECNELRDRIRISDNSDRYIFMGYAENLQEAMAEGDLFVNPPRTGGGTGATLALKNRTPIVTLGNCDVALRGEGFVCESLDRYPEIIKKYIHDAEFMKMQQEYCEQQDKLLNSVDSIGNMKKFCEELRNYIVAEEEKNGTYSV